MCQTRPHGVQLIQPARATQPDERSRCASSEVSTAMIAVVAGSVARAPIGMYAGDGWVSIWVIMMAHPSSLHSW